MPTITLVKTSSGLNMIRDSLAGNSNPKITYFALGSGTATPLSSDTQLASERFRKAISSYTTGSNGEILIDCYIAPTDAVSMDIEEVAAFGGSAATTTANSGVMLGRALWSHNPKSSQESIDLKLDITFS